MQQSDANTLPERVETEADAILMRAKGLATKHFGESAVGASPELTANIATMMMQSYSAMVLYDGLARLTQATADKGGK